MTPAGDALLKKENIYLEQWGLKYNLVVGKNNLRGVRKINIKLIFELGYWLPVWGVVNIPAHFDASPHFRSLDWRRPLGQMASPFPHPSRPGGFTCPDPRLARETLRWTPWPFLRPPFPCRLSGHLWSCYKCFEGHFSGGSFWLEFCATCLRMLVTFLDCLFGYFFMYVQAFYN